MYIVYYTARLWRKINKHLLCGVWACATYVLNFPPSSRGHRDDPNFFLWPKGSFFRTFNCKENNTLFSCAKYKIIEYTFRITMLQNWPIWQKSLNNKLLPTFKFIAKYRILEFNLKKVKTWSTYIIVVIIILDSERTDERICFTMIRVLIFLMTAIISFWRSKNLSIFSSVSGRDKCLTKCYF